MSTDRWTRAGYICELERLDEYDQGVIYISTHDRSASICVKQRQYDQLGPSDAVFADFIGLVFMTNTMSV
jgi:hypothetical protein